MRETPFLIAAAQHRCTPSTLTSKTRHHSRGSRSHVAPSWLPIPAFATSRSTGADSARSTAAASETSSWTARPPISAATASTWSSERAATVTSQPSAASTRAMFAPIPRPPPVTKASGNRSLDCVERLRVLERRYVAGVGSERLRADGTAHDLRRARLRQCVDEEHAVRLERLTELRSDVRRDLLLCRRHVRQQAREDPGRLALHLVRHADGGRLAHGRMPDRGRLELGRPDPLAGDVERVVGTAVQEPEAVLVDRRPVAVHPHAGQPRPVCVEKLLRVAPEATRHARERTAADQLADLARADERPSLVVDDVHRHPERRASHRARLDRARDGGREEARADLG